MEIVCIDLDGVIVEYPQNWIEYINEKTKSKFNNLNQIKETLSFSQYKELKQTFRETGMERKAKIREGAAEFMQKLDTTGHCIVLLTARPIYEIKQVMFDTLEWLKHHNIPYHLLFQGKDKHNKIMKYFNEIKFMVEDNGRIAEDVAKLGFKCYLIDNEYNQNTNHINIKRIKGFKEVKI